MEEWGMEETDNKQTNKQKHRSVNTGKCHERNETRAVIEATEAGVG